MQTDSAKGPLGPVSVDGPAGAGKSTIARLLARELGLVYVDSGAIYRAIALWVLEQGLRVEGEGWEGEVARRLEAGEPALEVLPGPPGSGEPTRIRLNGREVTDQIRDAEVSRWVSAVSSLACVRDYVTNLARAMARRRPGIVMDGRDIGTVVLPWAKPKLYLTAKVEERARRRKLELEARGAQVSLERLREEIARRDRLDSSRSLAPLRPAPDAYRIDTTGRSVEEVLAEALELCRRSWSE